METNIPDNCGNSPRSLLAIDIAVNLAANKYDKLEPLLAEDFAWRTAGSDSEIVWRELSAHMDQSRSTKNPVAKLEILTSISHGKYAAVSGRAHRTDGSFYSFHDLYEFTGASSSAKLKVVTSYVVEDKI